MVNVFPVNLEYLQFVDLDDAEQQRLVDATINAQLEPLKRLTFDEKKTALILAMIFWEVNLPKSPIKQNFLHFEKKCNDLGVKAHLITRIELQDFVVDIENSTCIDFFLLRSIYYTSQHGQLLNHKWHSDNKKFLFLMGKSTKPHRIGLLYRFYKQGMLDDNCAIWSFYDQLSVDECKKYVPKDATFEDIRTLVNDYRRLPDQAVPINNHYQGFPFDPQLYKNTNLSVVSETMCREETLSNTEKIYRAILNHHPFVIAGPPGHTQYLQDMGFETFDQYFSVPTYGAIVNLNSRLDAIVENVKSFDPNTNEIDQIHSLTQKNFQKVYELADHYTNTINKMFAGYNITVNWSDFLFQECNPYYLTWQFYYQTIKDPLWPLCDSIEDCVNLPEQIQEELRTVFKLKF